MTLENVSQLAHGSSEAFFPPCEDVPAGHSLALSCSLSRIFLSLKDRGRAPEDPAPQTHQEHGGDVKLRHAAT